MFYNYLLLALSPDDIKVFFEPVIARAVQILETYKSINHSQMPSSESFDQYRHPVITVSQYSY